MMIRGRRTSAENGADRARPNEPTEPMSDLLAEILERLRPLRLLRWAAVALACVAAWMFLNYEHLREYFDMRERLDRHRAGNARLERTREELLREREALEAGGFPAEKAIRERLLMSKPGERIIFLEEPENRADERTPEARVPQPGTTRE